MRSSYWVPSGLMLLDPKQIDLPELGDTEVDIHYFENSLAPDHLEMIKNMERYILLQPRLNSTAHNFSQRSYKMA